MNSLRLALACLLAVCVTGCPGPTGSTDGGGGGGAGDGGGGGLLQSQLCDKFAQAVCNREATCKFIDSAQSTQCLAAAKLGCGVNVDKFITAGARTWDATKAQACLTAITATRCVFGQGITSTGAVFSLPDECSLTNFPAAGKLNTPCATVSDCTQGFCGAPPGGCATCTAYMPTGAVCNFADKRCDPDAGACDLLSDAGRQCNAYVPVGQLCTATSVTCDPRTGFCPPGNSDAGLPDGGARNCTAKLADGQLCNFVGSRCQSGICVTFPDAGTTCGFRAVGAGCTSHSSCGPSNYCKGYLNNFPGVTEGVCTVRVVAAGACTNQFNDNDPATGEPRDGCAAGSCIGGKCKAADYSGAVSSECDRLIGNCAEDFYCKDYDADQPDGGSSLNIGTCTARLDQDAGCDFSAYIDTDCKQAFTCNNDNVCDALKSAGGQCQANYYCKDLLGCPRDAGAASFGACTPWQQPGADCSLTGTICSNSSMNERVGFCAYDAGLTGFNGPGLCSAALAANATCNANGQCASGRCRRADGGVGGIGFTDGGREFGSCVAPCLP